MYLAKSHEITMISVKAKSTKMLDLLNWIRFQLPFNLSSPVLTALFLVPLINEQTDKFPTRWDIDHCNTTYQSATPSDYSVTQKHSHYK